MRNSLTFIITNTLRFFRVILARHEALGLRSRILGRLCSTEGLNSLEGKLSPAGFFRRIRLPASSRVHVTNYSTWSIARHALLLCVFSVVSLTSSLAQGAQAAQQEKDTATLREEQTYVCDKHGDMQLFVSEPAESSTLLWCHDLDLYIQLRLMRRVSDAARLTFAQGRAE